MICLQVHNDYLIEGGETKSAKLIADLLNENGIKVIRYYKSNEELKKKNKIKQVYLGLKSIYNKDTLKEIQQIIDEYDIDFALIHNTSPLISNSVYKVLKKNKIPIYKYLQNYNLLCLNGALDQGDTCIKCKKNLKYGVYKKCYKNNFLYTLLKYISKKLFDTFYSSTITGYIAISEYIKNIHVNYGIDSEKIYVLYHFCENIVNIGNNDAFSNKSYLYMGRLAREKGLYTLVNSFKDLSGCTLDIMGTGVLEKELQDYISLEKMDNIRLIGFKDGEEKNKILKSAKALIVPSEWDEPFGRIVIEAYQQGIPVIAANRGGLSELVNNNITGYKFEAANIEDLVKCINKLESLSSQEYIEMRRNCIRQVEQLFCKEIYIENFRNIIKFK